MRRHGGGPDRLARPGLPRTSEGPRGGDGEDEGGELGRALDWVARSRLPSVETDDSTSWKMEDTF